MRAKHAHARRMTHRAKVALRAAHAHHRRAIAAHNKAKAAAARALAARRRAHHARRVAHARHVAAVRRHHAAIAALRRSKAAAIKANFKIDQDKLDQLKEQGDIDDDSYQQSKKNLIMSEAEMIRQLELQMEKS